MTYSYDLPEGLPEENAQCWLDRASRLIDRLTLGRAASGSNFQCEALSDACGQIALLLYYRQTARESSRGGLLASASNDGYSESYSAGEAAGSVEAQAREILSACLGADAGDLLYRGVGLC